MKGNTNFVVRSINWIFGSKDLSAGQLTTTPLKHNMITQNNSGTHEMLDRPQKEKAQENFYKFEKQTVNKPMDMQFYNWH